MIESISNTILYTVLGIAALGYYTYSFIKEPQHLLGFLVAISAVFLFFLGGAFLYSSPYSDADRVVGCILIAIAWGLTYYFTKDR